MTPLRELLRKIENLEKESRKTIHLDTKISVRITETKRKILIDEIQKALTIFDLNARKRRPLPHLYVYAMHVPPEQVFDPRLDYNFLFITSQELEVRKNLDPESILVFIKDSCVRLTEYTDFKNRINQLIKNIELRNLEDFLGLTYGEFIYEIMGNVGKFLSYIGVNLQNSKTKILLDKKEKEIRVLIEARSPINKKVI